MHFLPALLLSADYVRAIIKGIAPKIDDKVLDGRVAARMERQKVLESSRPPRYRAVIDEAVLQRHVGGPDVMRGQLERIPSLMRDDRITVQVIPYTVGAYGSQDSNFTYMEFGDTKLPDLVYVENLVTHLYMERPDEVDRYREAIDLLRDAALNPRDSAKKIEEIRDEF